MLRKTSEEYEIRRREAVAAARSVLEGRLGICEGSRALAQLGHDLVLDWTADPDFVVFGGVDSESDCFPFGPVRDLWNPTALADGDAEREEYERRVSAIVIAACRSILVRLGGANQIEKRVLEMLLAGEHELLSVLRTQLHCAEIARRELTGVGFFTHFTIPAELPRAPRCERRVIGDVYAEITGLQHAAGFLLFVSGGKLDFLECFIVDDQWPETASLRRPYYVHPSAPGSDRLVETGERDLRWALRDTV